MRRDEFFAQWSALHGGAKIEGIVKIWLGISFQSARALTKLRISPNALTLFGVLASISLYLLLLDNPGSYLFALLLLAISLAADGIDGSLAVVSKKGSRAGANLDALADRVSESFWALALYLIGGDYRLVLAAWLLSSIQEYIRARSAGLGLRDIGIVTICERPVRASLIAIALATLFFADQIGSAGEISKISLATWIALIWVLMQAFSIVTLWKFIRKNIT
jgi:CDP-diacylglycerol--glycerol-3-phosphate 3-phosphatidyltransferase